MMSQEDLEAQRRQLEEEKYQLAQEWEAFRKEKAAFEDERKESGIEYKMFIGNLDETTTESDIREYTQGYGTLKEVIMLKDHSGKSKRSCFVKYYTKKAAENCLDGLNNKVRDKDSQKMMVVRFADKSSNAPQAAPLSAAPPSSYNPYNDPYPSYPQHRAAAPLTPSYSPYPPASSYGPTRTTNFPSTTPSYGRGPTGANLYINNLAPNSTEADVRAMFADFGTVLSVKCFTNHNYGFVSYDSPSAAQAAINALNGLSLGDNGRLLEVSFKKEGGGGGGGGRATRFSPY